MPSTKHVKGDSVLKEFTEAQSEVVAVYQSINYYNQQENL